MFKHLCLELLSFMPPVDKRAEVYAALVQLPFAIVDMLAESSRLPREEVEEALSWFVDMGLAVVVPGNPRMYKRVSTRTNAIEETGHDS